MPSAANAKSEKPASSEAADNSPVRQIMTIIEHKIRNLEKRKSKLTSYRDLQKAGKELKSDQKVAVAKYDEVVQTLEFARDLSKQIAAVAVSAEREAKKQAKKDAWVRCAADTSKIREVLLILDCLMQMGSAEARDDFLQGTNGAAKLTEEDLKILDDLYPEVTPKHEINEEGQPGFHVYTARAAEHLYSIIDGKPKEVLGTTYAHIKEIITAVHECGYFDKVPESEPQEVETIRAAAEEEPQELCQGEVEPEMLSVYGPPTGLPVPPAAAVVPAPGYPLRPLPPITLQEVENSYFNQQYTQQRPISEVIGSQNFFFLQESEIDSPVGTPQPIMTQGSPSAIPTQTFTNQHFVRVSDPAVMAIPQPHYAPHPDHGTFTAVPMAAIPTALPHMPQHPPVHEQPPLQAPRPAPVECIEPTPVEDKKDDWQEETRSPERDENGDRKTQGQGDGQNRFRRFGRGRGAPNGYRGRGAFQSRQGGDYHNRHNDYQGRSANQSRQYNDGYQSRSKDNHHRGGNDAYYGNGDASDDHNENGTRDRYNDNNQNYQGGFKGRGRGARAPRGAPRPPRPQQYNRKPENAE